MSIALFVLTLNEVDGMKKIMPEVKKVWTDELILIDGGSKDGTLEEAKKLGLNILRQKNTGAGDGVLLGLAYTNADFIVLYGPDGNHEPKETLLLRDKIKEGYDQVIISRFGKGSVNLDAGLLDTFGNKMFTFLTNVFFGGHFTATLNGSRSITRKAVLEVSIDAMKNEFVLEMTIRGIKRGHKFFEIVGNEGVRIGGERKITTLHTGAFLSWQIIREFIFWNR